MGHFSPGASPAIRIAEKHTALEGKPAALRHLSNFLPRSESGWAWPWGVSSSEAGQWLLGVCGLLRRC